MTAFRNTQMELQRLKNCHERGKVNRYYTVKVCATYEEASYEFQKAVKLYGYAGWRLVHVMCEHVPEPVGTR